MGGLFGVLGIVGITGAVIVFALRSYLSLGSQTHLPNSVTKHANGELVDEPDRDWPSFAVLISLAAIQGMVYSGVITFLKTSLFSTRRYFPLFLERILI